MAFREQAHRPIFDLVVDDHQRLALRRIEGRRRLTGIHGRQQHVVLVVQIGFEADLAGVAIHRVGIDFRDKDDASITPVIMGHDYPLRRTERELLPEGRKPHADIGLADIGAHHLADRQVADPADIVGAANALATQVKTPGGEGVTERGAYHERGGDDGGKHQSRDLEVTGQFQRQKRHGQRATDDGGGKGAHADHGINDGCCRTITDIGGTKRENLAEQRSHEQRGEKQAAAEIRTDGNGAGRRLQQEQPGQPVYRQFCVDIEMQRAVAARQHLR
ncbi:hypothetical protein D3C86_1477180 [compost metagenome]